MAQCRAAELTQVRNDWRKDWPWTRFTATERWAALVDETASGLGVFKDDEIRRRFNDMATKSPPAWRFENDRQHWTRHHATDEGFPLNGAWRIRFGDQRPRLESPTHCWQAGQAPVLEMELRYQGQATQGRILWKCLEADRYETERSLTFDLVPAEAFRTYRFDLSGSPGYRGLITGLAFDPIAEPLPGGQIVIRSIRFLTPPPEVEAKR